jgi:hypothetical protein
VGAPRRIAICAPLAAAALLTGSCGDDDDKGRTVDATKVEQAIEKDLSTSTAEIQSVSCPDDEKSETGAKFTCSAKFDGGGSAKVTVTETQAPNQFTYEFKAGTVKLSGASVDKALEKDLAAGGAPDATVNCPSTIEVKTGTTVSCPVSGARGGSASVTFEFSDDSGSIDESSVDTGG